jgi:hypothetical protein
MIKKEKKNFIELRSAYSLYLSLPEGEGTPFRHYIQRR